MTDESRVDAPLEKRVAAITRFVRFWVVTLCVSLLLITGLLYNVIHGVAVRSWNSCQSNNADATTWNKLLDQTINNTQVSKVLTAKEKTKRVADYQAIKKHVQDCGGKP